MPHPVDNAEIVESKKKLFSENVCDISIVNIMEVRQKWHAFSNHHQNIDLQKIRLEIPVTCDISTSENPCNG